VRAHDAAAVYDSAHALKGAAANVSAAALTECSLSLEIIARSSHYDAALAHSTWLRLQSEAERVLTAAGGGVTVALGEPTWAHVVVR
jgi:HPt (histidine-containing phosphotransfer) domain-containing protein